MSGVSAVFFSQKLSWVEFSHEPPCRSMLPKFAVVNERGLTRQGKLHLPQDKSFNALKLNDCYGALAHYWAIRCSMEFPAKWANILFIGRKSMGHLSQNMISSIFERKTIKSGLTDEFPQVLQFGQLFLLRISLVSKANASQSSSLME